jgi:hypothetical protein
LVALDRQNIWWDEARNIDVALRPLASVAVAPELDIHPPLYFWLLHLWSRTAGVSLLFAPEQIAYLTRFLSVAAGVVGIVLVAQLAQRAARPAQWAGVAAALLGSFAPFWLGESQETRMYTVGFALLTAAAVLLLMAWARDAIDPRRARLPLVGFVLCSAAALLTHYNALFILAAWYVGGGGGALVHPARRRMLTLMLLCGGATLLLVVPVLPIALRQIPDYANPNLTIPTLGDYLLQNWQAYLGGYAFDGGWMGGAATGWLWAVLVLVAAGLVMALRQAERVTPLGFLLLWLVGGLALYYVAVLDRGAFNVRYSSFVTPALYALMGVGLTAWSRQGKPLATVATVAVAMISVVAFWPQALQADLYGERGAREDIAGVTDWLREHAGPDAVIFVDQKYPFGFYYGRYAIDPAEAAVGPEAAPARYLFVDINTIDAQLARWAQAATEVYWVQWFESDTDPRRAVAFLLDQQGERGEEQQFRGYSIDWWRLTPPNRFVLGGEWTPLGLRFGETVEAVEASLPSVQVAPGEPLPVVLRWQRVADGDVQRPLKARVALYDADGARISQRDERLLNDRHVLPAEWSPTDRPLNVYLLDVPDDLAPGSYSIGLLVYDAESLEPVSLLDGAGNPTGVEAILGMVEVVDGVVDEVTEHEP